MVRYIRRNKIAAEHFLFDSSFLSSNLWLKHQVRNLKRSFVKL